MKTKTKTPLSLEDIQAQEYALCRHCACTDFGLDMEAPKIKPYSIGCEGAWCDEAYEHYLDNAEEDIE